MSERYFKCPEFKLTMPVAECESRRKLAKSSTAAASSEIKRSLMTKRCGQCKVFSEAIAESISSEAMMASVKASPCMGDPLKKSSFSNMSTLRTPYTSSSLRRGNSG